MLRKRLLIFRLQFHYHLDPGIEEFNSGVINLKINFLRWSMNASLTENGQQFAGYIFKLHFSDKNVHILVQISLKFLHRGPIDNQASIVLVMDLHLYRSNHWQTMTYNTWTNGDFMNQLTGTYASLVFLRVHNQYTWKLQYKNMFTKAWLTDLNCTHWWIETPIAHHNHLSAMFF